MTSDVSWLDSMPEIYDRLMGPALFEPFAHEVAQRAGALKPREVLELAAGTGIATAQLVKALPDAAVTATDLNPAMVSWAAKRVPGATWLQADAQALDHADASFDLVVCQFGAMFFPDKPGAYAEARRVLTPGGTLLLAIWDVAELSPFPAALTRALQAVLPEDPPTFVQRVPHGYADVAQIRSDLEAGGFHDITIEKVVLPGSSPSAAHITEGFCQGSPLRFALQERGDLDDLTARLAASMTQILGTGPLVADNAALIVTARG